MTVAVERVAMIAMHTSPVAQPGRADAGGLNVSVLGLAGELAERGVGVDLFTRARTRAAQHEVRDGVTLFELGAGPRGPLPKDELPAVIDEFGEGVARIARSRRYDVIHAHYWLSGIAALPVAIELGRPLVQSFHTLAVMKNAFAEEGHPVEPEQRVRSEMFLAAQAEAIIASSSAEATVLIDEVAAPPDRTWIVPPGVDLERFSPRAFVSHDTTRGSLGLEPDRPLVVIAGRVQPLKGHELAIRALAELHALRGWAPLLVVAGEATPGDAGFAGRLRTLAAELGVGPDVRFVGALHPDELAALFATADLTIVPSFSETFGLVALESAAAGTPVIAYRTGGLSDAVHDGVSGLLLGTREPRYWATEIALLIEDDERRTALGVTARGFAERFTWGAAAASLLGVYAGLGRP